MWIFLFKFMALDKVDKDPVKDLFAYVQLLI